MAAGCGMVLYSEKTPANQAIYQGFGCSVVLQGVALIAFDNVMYTIHQRGTGKWLQIMDEIRITGGGVGFIHKF
jgi:hypothetical protein